MTPRGPAALAAATSPRAALLLSLLLAPAAACGPDRPGGVPLAGAGGAGARAGGGGAAGGPDPAPAAGSVVFFAGGPSHGPGEHEYFAGATLLAAMLEQSGVASTVVRDWPEGPGAFERADAIVFLTDGADGHPLAPAGGFAKLEPHLARGAGLGCVHWSVHLPASAGPAALRWLGGYYLDGVSVNPVWTASFGAPAAHPAARGVAPFELRDEWYYALRFADGPGAPTPLLAAAPPDDTRFTPEAASHPGRAETVAWAFERADGGRSFGTTGAHFHRNWGDPNLRRLVVNAILWIARREVPEGGAPVAMPPAMLEQNLDPKASAER